ncbi:MAG: hypothetical protein JNL92_02600, partial [Opitutaceae bacterium]|nr:hypothetical protein [Opitutaceae bacterium]
RRSGCFLLLFLAACSLAAQTDSPLGRRIVEVRSRPASLPPAQLSLQPGQILTSAALSAAMNEIKDHLGRRAEAAAALTGGGSLSFTYVTADFDLQPPGHPGNDAVGVTLRPFHFSLPLEDTGSRVLPIPRDLGFSLAPGRRAPLALPATVTFGRDRVLGPTVGGRWLVQAGPAPADESRARLFRLRLDGLTSLDSALYSASGDVRAGREWASGLLRQVTGGLEGSAALTPRGAGRYDQRRWGGAAGVALALNANTRLRFDTRYGTARHRFSDTTAAAGWADTREQAGRALFETIPPRALGFLRAAVWLEHLEPRPGPAARRLVVRAGYAKEFPLGPNRSIGVEIIAGAGQTWGAPDAPRRYFAGGSQGEFLYENAAAPALAAIPDGPLLRSLGKAQGGLRPAPSAVRGGTRFSHLNLNVSLPVPRWSRPLIPDEVTDLPGPDGTPQTLKQILRSQVDRTGPNLLQSSLQVSDKLTPEEARLRANQIFGEIQPATHFVIDQANVFAVKPLLLFDIAELESGPERASWTAAGAGLQLVIVTAKFEAGYMHTLSGPRFGSRGNVFARLGFERLF